MPRVYDSITQLADEYKVTVKSAARWASGNYKAPNGAVMALA